MNHTNLNVVEHAKFFNIVGDQNLAIFDNETKANSCHTQLLTKSGLFLLSFGYLRKYNINPTDIGTILSKYIGYNEWLISK